MSSWYSQGGPGLTPQQACPSQHDISHAVSSPAGRSLTQAERLRMEHNRLAALQRRREALSRIGGGPQTALPLSAPCPTAELSSPLPTTRAHRPTCQSSETGPCHSNENIRQPTGLWGSRAHDPAHQYNNAYPSQGCWAQSSVGFAPSYELPPPQQRMPTHPLPRSSTSSGYLSFFSSSPQPNHMFGTMPTSTLRVSSSSTPPSQLNPNYNDSQDVHHAAMHPSPLSTIPMAHHRAPSTAHVIRGAPSHTDLHRPVPTSSLHPGPQPLGHHTNHPPCSSWQYQYTPGHSLAARPTEEAPANVKVKRSAKRTIKSKRRAVPAPTAPSPPRNNCGPMKKFDSSAYGPSSTFTFEPAPMSSLHTKKLTQATLGDVMKRYRAGKQDRQQQLLQVPEAAPVVEQMEDEAPKKCMIITDIVTVKDAVAPIKDTCRNCLPLEKGDFLLSSAAPEAACTKGIAASSPCPSSWNISPPPCDPDTTAPHTKPRTAPRLLLAPSSPNAMKMNPNKTRMRACVPPTLSESTTSTEPEHPQQNPGATSRDPSPSFTHQQQQQRWTWLKHRRDAQGRLPDDSEHDPRTLQIPASDFSRLRGFHRQYWKIKREFMDLVLFVRVGSFYELYDTDADVGLRVGLNPMGSMTEPNMWRVGCNAASFARWAARVLALGHCVGRVEECHRRQRDEDPACAKLVARRLEQVYTPGTAAALEWARSHGVASPPYLLDDDTRADENIHDDDLSLPFVALFEGSHGRLGACAVDVPSCTVALGQWQEMDAGRSTLSTLLTQINPVEVVVLGRADICLDTRKVLKRHRVLVSDGIERRLVTSYVPRRFTLAHDPERPEDLPGLIRDTEASYVRLGGNETTFSNEEVCRALYKTPHAAAALQIALCHLSTTGIARRILPHAEISAMTSFTREGAHITGHMMLDSAALRSLEVLEGSCGGIKGSLLAFLSAGAATSAGRRCIRQWLCAPLYRKGDIEERLNAVAVFMKLPEAAGTFHGALRKVPDCERLLPKVAALMEDTVARVPEDRATLVRNKGLQDGGGDDVNDEITSPDVHVAVCGDHDANASITRVSHQKEATVVCGEDAEQNSSGAPDPDDALTWNLFTPVLRLLEGLSRMLRAVDELAHATQAILPGGFDLFPPLLRAVSYGRKARPVVEAVQPVFHPDRLLYANGAGALLLEPGISAECDAAAAIVQNAQSALYDSFDAARDSLLASAAAATKAAPAKTAADRSSKVRLTGSGVDVLLEGPIALKPHAPSSFTILKETKSLVRFRVESITAAAQHLAAATAASQKVVVRHLQHSASLFLKEFSTLLAFCSSVAALDALAAFAETTHPEAAPPGCAFCRPVFDASVCAPARPAVPRLLLEGLWSPQLLLSDSPSVGTTTPSVGTTTTTTTITTRRNGGVRIIQPNDLSLGGPGCDGCCIDGSGSGSYSPGTLLLTGANTGGKTTLARAMCLAVIMAQVGCFVPCTTAELAPVDRIFTRMGAQDRLAAGESTFCVEMTETSAILRHAQRNSLVVLDELGRGTSTHDGTAIAGAVAQWLTEKTRCRMFFATHYHNLTRDGSLMASRGVALGHMHSKVCEEQGLVPSFRLCSGPAPDGSCGAKVAAVAGLPKTVVARAEEMSGELEKLFQYNTRAENSRTGENLLNKFLKPPCLAEKEGEHEEEALGAVEGLYRQTCCALRDVVAAGEGHDHKARRAVAVKLQAVQAAVRHHLLNEC